MTALYSYQSLEDAVNELQTDISEKLDLLVQNHPDLNIINSEPDFIIFGRDFPVESPGDGSPSSAKFKYDIGFHKVLSDLINLRSSENNDHQQHIALILDLSLYYANSSLFTFSMPLTLLQRIVTELPTEWLLKFWSFIDYRMPYISQKLPNLSPTKPPGLPFIAAINFRIEQLLYSNEPKRDHLRAKLLILASELFPDFQPLLINKQFEFNDERCQELKIAGIENSKDNLYYSFWSLQKFFRDPIEAIKSENSMHRPPVNDIATRLETVYKAIHRIEMDHSLPANAKQIDPDNRKTKYCRTDLSDGQKHKLFSNYKNKEFNPVFYYSQEKFHEQLKDNEYFRRTMLQQIIIACSFIDIVMDHLSESDLRSKGFHPKLQWLRSNTTPRFHRRITDMKKNIFDMFAKIDKRLYYVVKHLSMSSEHYFLVHKIHLFADYVKEYSEFEYDDKLKEVMAKRLTFKPKFWAAYGTAPISRHWKQATGLNLLTKDHSADWKKETELHLQRFKENVDQGNSVELNNWKALRLARTNDLFKFKHANDETGLLGLYDPSIKERLDEQRKILDATKIEEQAKRKDEAARARLVSQDESKKRKASVELSDDDRKKAKLSSASNDTVDLDY